MATVSTMRDDIKADVKELVDIVIEDKIFKEKIEEYRYYADITRKAKLQQKLEHELQVSYITDINRISKRFADKLLSVLSKYNQDEDRRLIFECIDLMATRERAHLSKIRRAERYQERIHRMTGDPK